jgi:hypothetical protein
MGDEMKQPTHDDWDRAKQQRDIISRHVVNAILAGETIRAEEHAKQWMMLDDQMLAISNILDAPMEQAK